MFRLGANKTERQKSAKRKRDSETVAHSSNLPNSRVAEKGEADVKEKEKTERISFGREITAIYLQITSGAGYVCSV